MSPIAMLSSESRLIYLGCCCYYLNCLWIYT